MVNQLRPLMIYEIRVRGLEGQGVREIARALKVSTNTVKNYYPYDAEACCGCGAPAGHNGWCAVRYARSPKRKAFMAKWHEDMKKARMITQPMRDEARKLGLEWRGGRWVRIGHTKNR